MKPKSQASPGGSGQHGQQAAQAHGLQHSWLSQGIVVPTPRGGRWQLVVLPVTRVAEHCPRDCKALYGKVFSFSTDTLCPAKATSQILSRTRGFPFSSPPSSQALTFPGCPGVLRLCVCGVSQTQAVVFSPFLGSLDLFLGRSPGTPLQKLVENVTRG